MYFYRSAWRDNFCSGCSQPDYEYYSATLLKNGNVLMAGGEPKLHRATMSAQLYNPNTNRWSNTGSMHEGRVTESFCSILLDNGQVLVAGGGENGDGDEHEKASELYNPATGLWTPTGFMVSTNFEGKCTKLNNGTILLAGGRPGKDSQLYDPTTGTWTATNPLKKRRRYSGMTLLQNGQVLFTGGVVGDYALPQRRVEIYDPATKSWESVKSMHNNRAHHTATLLKDGRVLVVGGVATARYSLATAEIYNPATDTWADTGSMLVPHYLHHAVLLKSGKVLVTGGFIKANDLTELSDSELYDPVTGRWTMTSNSMGPINRWHTTTLLPSGKVLVTLKRNKAILYDPDTDLWNSDE